MHDAFSDEELFWGGRKTRQGAGKLYYGPPFTLTVDLRYRNFWTVQGTPSQRWKAVGKALVLLEAILCLSSCQILEFISGSVFSPLVTLMKAQVDLSGQIQATDGGAFAIRVVESGGAGYVIVIGPQTGSSYSIAYCYDLDLNLKSTQTNLLGGSGVMVDADGYIMLGSRQLNPADLSLNTTVAPEVTLTNPEQGGVDGFPGSGANFYDLTINGASYSTSHYNSTWTTAGAAMAPIALSGNFSSLQIMGTFYDSSSGSLFLVAAPSGSSSAYFLPPTLATDVLDASPHHDNIEAGTIGYSQGSIFAYDTGSSSMLRIDPSTGTTQNSFYLGSDPSTVRFAYRISGGSFYGFNTKTRTLTKYTQWW